MYTGLLYTVHCTVHDIVYICDRCISYHYRVHIVLVSDCVTMPRLIQLHIQEWLQAYFPLPFTRPVLLLRLPYFFLPATSWVLYTWAQSAVHCVWRHLGPARSQPVQGCGGGNICEHNRQCKFKVATYACIHGATLQSVSLMGIGVVVFHIICWICQIIVDRGDAFQCAWG